MDSLKSKQLSIPPLVITISLLFALSFGLRMGGNQNTYLLFALKKLHPELWCRDWLVTNTHHYHLFFNYVAIILGQIGNLFWTLALLNFFIISVFCLLFYRLLLRLKINRLFLVFGLNIFFLTLEGTDSIGQSYVFSSVLQPSSISSIFFILAMFSYIQRKDALAGVLFGVSGVFHENFLVLIFPMVLLSDFFCGRRDPKTIAKHLAPSCIVLVCEIPLLLKCSLSVNSDLARYIFQVIRAPHHYYPKTFLMDYMLFVGWHLFAIAGLKRFLLPQLEERRRLVALYGATMLLPLIATLLTTIVYIPQVSQVYFFRLAPYSVLFARVIGFSAATEMMFLSDSSKLFQRRNIIIYSAYFLSFAFLSIYYLKEPSYFPKKSIFYFISITLIIIATLYVKEKNRTHSSMVESVLVILLFVGFLGRMVNYHEKFNLVFGCHPTRAQMYRWARSTELGSLFLISPGLLEDFRIRSRRSVVVDWKSTPILPDELIQWYQRIRDISGGREITNMYEAVNFYHSLARDKLEKIKKKYDVDYAVFFKKWLKQDYNYPVAFQNKEFVVYRLQ